jgi:hypothetical protein
MSDPEEKEIPVASTRKESFGSCRVSCARRDDGDYRREYYDLKDVNEALRLAAALQEAAGHVLSHDRRNKERTIRLWLAGKSDDNMSITVYPVAAARR